jgi:hypothetical protein
MTEKIDVETVTELERVAANPTVVRATVALLTGGA